MVHTRHSKDVEVDSPPIFLSLNDRKSRKSINHAAEFDEHDSDQSGVVYQRKKHQMFEEKGVESRLRPRTGPSKSYNYVFADSSDDDVSSRRRSSRILSEEEFSVSRSKVHRRRIKSRNSSDEDGQKRRKSWKRTESELKHTKIRQIKTQQKEVESEGDDDEGEEYEEHNEDGDEDHDEDDANNSAVRRSSRLKRKPFRFRGSNKKSRDDDDNEEDDDNEGNFDKGKRGRSGDADNSSEEFDDMYSRVKRPRRSKKIGDRNENSASNSDGTHDEKNDSEEESQQRRSYSLREHKPRTQLYIAPPIDPKKRTKQQSLFHRDSPPPSRRRVPKQATYCSPAHRKPNIRKRHAFHGSSSSTSSSSDSGTETSDEQRFNRRKAKSMNKARSRICPLNFSSDMMSSGVLKDRVRTGASLADVDPMEIDKSVTFESVGGLQEHIVRLKEMVVFPLLYPEFYEKFKVTPSRGVLFYGPPGTGKTLVARALANECSRGAQKVAFFMRKGADCLSKWVGEAERQLRLLFDKAYEMRPSIIFFDEIDGLAPVRSSRQDQIHSSIVSTLLALMDGIDSRGEIVVIGATNRIDSIDPALRRPGRFDREFHFPLPNVHDRKNILKIHTKNWNPSLRDDFMSELAEKCAGYCGADLKCLVTEATQNALRRHYPQIYTTSDKLQLDVSSIVLSASDFAQAVSNIVPAAQRAVPNPASALEVSVRPLLSSALLKLQTALAGRFPYSKQAGQGLANAQQDGASDSNETQRLMLSLPMDEEENAPSIFMPTSKGHKTACQQPAVSFLKFASSSSVFPAVFRPRMLVAGAAGQGQSVHLAPAALHLMEHLPVHILSSATLFAASAKMPEEACANVFHEAKRTAPSIIFIPYINELWGVVSDSLRVTFLTLIRSMSPTTPVLMLATSEITYLNLDDQLKILFSVSGGEVVEVDCPTKEERHNFFHDLIMLETIKPPPTHKQAARRVLEPLAKAPPPEPRKLTDKEQKRLRNREEDTLRELRIFLRDILGKLGREKKFAIFTKPVDVEEVPDYCDIITRPMDLSTMMSNIDLHKYNTASAFLDDIFLICSNALEYNPDRGPIDRGIRHRACALRDMAQALLKAELDPDFERLCQEINESRRNNGVDSSGNVPAFYHTRPSEKHQQTPECSESTNAVPESAIPEGCRYSRRVRGLDADRAPSLETVEKSVQIERSLLTKDTNSEMEHTPVTELSGSKNCVEGVGVEEKKVDNHNSSIDDSVLTENSVDTADQTDCMCPDSGSKTSAPIQSEKSKGSNNPKHFSSHASKKASLRKKCPWLATRRRRRHHSTPLHRPEIANGEYSVEINTDESMELDSPVKPSQGCDPARRSHREHFPMSAANPANVNITGIPRTRHSTDAIPQSQHHDLSKPKTVTILQDKAEESSKPQKSGVARNLDVELLAADSGISSESNGDSRDSLDHNNSNRNGGSAAHQDNTAANTSASGPSFARTRSRTQNPLQMSALAALEVETSKVQVDKEELTRLLETVVGRTSHFTVEKLQHLYSMLSCTIFNHRYQVDKMPLIKEMECVVDSACQDKGCH